MILHALNDKKKEVKKHVLLFLCHHNLVVSNEILNSHMPAKGHNYIQSQLALYW